MKCSNVKDFIFTDYIDLQLSPQQHSDLLSHLADCENCRKLFFDANINLSDINNIDVDSDIRSRMWSNIAERVSVVANVENKVQPIRRKLWGSNYRYFALGLIAASLVVYFNINIIPSISNQNIVGATYYLADYDVDSVINDDIGFGSVMEEYLI